MTNSTHPGETQTSPIHAGPPFRRMLLVVCLAGLAVFAAFFIAGKILLHRADPMIKAKLIETLSTRFDSRIELERFEVSMVHGFEVSGRGLRLYPNHLGMSEPMLRASDFSFHLLGWQELFRSPLRINRVLVRGLTVRIPPPHQRANLLRFPKRDPDMAARTLGIKAIVGQILIDRADLIIENGNPAKQPLHFIIHRLRLDAGALGRPMRFHALMVNAKPVGNIDTSGDFGPFKQESPGETAVNGTYSFSHANLNQFNGIGGTLSSTGTYVGRLNQIEVNGKTQTPNFSLDTAGHPLPLNATFHAIVDGTSGDTFLSPVDAWLCQTHILANGKVIRNPSGDPGHEIQLDVRIGPGRIQDILDLASDRQPALMNGSLRLHTDLFLPPGTNPVIDRIRLKGTFVAYGLHFTSTRVQEKVDELSLRGQGKARKAKKQADALKAGDIRAATAANIASEMRGDFLFVDRHLSLTGLDYNVPGATIALSGVYNLNGQTLNFHGTARLDAHISQMVTGWKSILLKPVDPFFAKHGAGTELAVGIAGTRSNPQIGIGRH